MANWTIEETVDLAKGGEPKHEARPYDLMLPGNNKAHVWKVTVLNNDAPASLSNVTQVKGTFVRQRDPSSKVEIIGTVSGNSVSVTLVTACYAYGGSLRGIMEITTSAGEVVTLSEKYFRVREPKPGQTVDPGNAFPDIEQQALILENVQNEVGALGARLGDIENAPALTSELTLKSGWTYHPDYPQPVRVVRRGYLVFLEGVVTNSSAVTMDVENTVTLATLPSWARPARAAHCLNQGTTQAIFKITAEPSGALVLSRYRMGAEWATVAANSYLCLTSCWLSSDATGSGAETVDDLEDLIARMEAVATGAVRYDAGQSLTTAQKTQARSNIGITGAIADSAVRYDVTQSLTDAQKSRARSNIGAADDADVTELKGAFEDTGLQKITQLPYFTQGYINTNTGWAGRSSGNNVCGIYPVIAGQNITVTANASYDAQIAMLASFNNPADDDTPDFSSDSSWTAVVTVTKGTTINITVPSDTHYLYVWFGNRNTLVRVPNAIIVDGYDCIKSALSNVQTLGSAFNEIVGEINEINSEINEINSAVGTLSTDVSVKANAYTVNGKSVSEQSQPLVIGSNGIWQTANARHIFLNIRPEDIINITAGSYATVYALLKTDYCVSARSADFTETYNTRVVLNADANTGNITAPSDANYLYVAVKDTAGHDLTPVSILINGVEQTYGVRKKIDDLNALVGNIAPIQSLQWLANIIAGQASDKVIHCSIDDVTFMSALLANPAPASIWDVEEFAKIKEVHDNTNACFTLMCFNEATGYDIANIPNTWASEFQAAKSWLRFAFHAKDANTSYGSANTAATDYAKFVNAVYAFTGTYDTIDRVPRLGNFAGTLTQCKAIANLAYGPIGFLSADDSRQSYYLSQSATYSLNAHGRYYDITNKFIFVPTLPRLDTGVTADATIATIQSKSSVSDKYIEIFCHQTSVSSNTIARINKFSNVIAWATEHGYSNGFLMDYFN